MIKIKIETDCTALKNAGSKVKKSVVENTKPIGGIIGQLLGGLILSPMLIIPFIVQENPIFVFMCLLFGGS